MAFAVKLQSVLFADVGVDVWMARRWWVRMRRCANAIFCLSLLFACLLACLLVCMYLPTYVARSLVCVFCLLVRLSSPPPGQTGFAGGSDHQPTPDYHGHPRQAIAKERVLSRDARPRCSGAGGAAVYGGGGSRRDAPPPQRGTACDHTVT